MGDEQDWSQKDPTRDQVLEWMKRMAPLNVSAVELARAAHEHFHRPYHINVLIDMAEKMYVR